MKTNTKTSDAALTRFLSSGLFRRIAFAIIAAVLTTVFVLRHAQLRKMKTQMPMHHSPKALRIGNPWNRL